MPAHSLAFNNPCMAASLRGLSPHSCPFLNCDLLISGRLMVVDKGFSILLSGLRSYLDSVVLGFGDGSFHASLPLSANICHVSVGGLGQEIIFCSMPQGSKYLLLFFLCCCFWYQFRILVQASLLYPL